MENEALAQVLDASTEGWSLDDQGRFLVGAEPIVIESTGGDGWTVSTAAWSFSCATSEVRGILAAVKKWLDTDT